MSILLFSTLLLGRGLATGSPRSLQWTDQPVGPDGPWNALIVPVDNNPAQNLTLLPSLTETALFIDEAACSNQSSACPIPTPALFSALSEDHKAYLWMDGPSFPASNFDKTVSEPLRLQGSAYRMHEKLILLEQDGSGHDVFDQAAVTTQDFRAHYPGKDISYTLATGLFSLNGAERHINWTNATGADVSQYTYLQQAVVQNYTKSISYGLHIGSVDCDVPPSLVIGGYDRSRCLSEPVSSSNQTFKLLDIGLGTTTGTPPFSSYNVNETSPSQSPNEPVWKMSGLLKESTGIQVMPNPGVPYLYLPKATCDAIASQIPVTYDANLGLYLWDTSKDTYRPIITSPSYLSFTLQGSSPTQNTTINVPFALLNLTLTPPLVSSPTPYFPCSPYTPSDTTFHLGRAFLQSALLAQKWKPTDASNEWSDDTTTTVWLSQAPGPEVPTSQLVTIDPSDETLTLASNGPTWNSTWSKALVPWVGGGLVQTPINSSSNKGLSTGAIVGIVIGIVAAIALLAAGLFIFLRRRRRRRRRRNAGSELNETSENSTGRETQQLYREGSHLQHSPSEAEERGLSEAGSTPLYEADGQAEKNKVVELPVQKGQDRTRAQEVDGRGFVAELPGEDNERR